MIHTRLWRSVRGLSLLLPLALAAACSDSAGGGDGCPTCPPAPTEGAIRLSVTYDGPQGDLAPSGFRASDVRNLEVTVQGPGPPQHLSLGPTQNAAFLSVVPGVYAITASAFGEGNLLLFTDETEVLVTLADTVNASLQMEAELGSVTVDVDGRTSGTVQAIAGEPIPFTVTVRNSEGRVVPGSVVDVKSSNPTYADAAEAGTDVTNAQGQVTGFIRAPFSGSINLSVTVDGRAVANATTPTGVTFAAGVNPGGSLIEFLDPNPNGTLLFANGTDTYSMTVVVRDESGDPLPRTPIVVRSTRNQGLDPNVDILEPVGGVWETNAEGRLTFTVRSTTSSFFHLEESGVLSSEATVQFPMGEFIAAVLTVEADGVEIDQQLVRWNSTVFPGPGSGSITANKAVVQANGQDSAIITVTATQIPSLGGGPVRGGYVELTNAVGMVLNEVLNLDPLPGYEDFRTDANGQWQARIRSTTPGFVFLSVKVDGRALILESSRLITFQ